MFVARIVTHLFTIFAIMFAGLLGAFLYVLQHQHIDFSALERYRPGQPSIVLDDEGHEWARFQLDRREPITYDKMPEHLIKAFVAAEDWRYFEHSGLSWRGIARSTLVNLYHGRIVQGASTITQQLVKLLFFDNKRTFKRKVKEQVYAVLVERQCTKEQIVEAYLNHVYFGCGIYGVEAASQRFWGKRTCELSESESATLAGIVRLPEAYCPINYPLSAQKRRDTVLYNMQHLGFIHAEIYKDAKELAVCCRELLAGINAPHLKEAVRLFVEEHVGKELLYCGGLTIQTTINADVQARAEKAFTERLRQLRKSINAQLDGALISLEAGTGEIKALIGGYDFVVSKYNRALQSKRQIGSLFKPLIYAAAMEKGMTFADTEIDEPIEMLSGNEMWKPRNWYRDFFGQVTLAYALARSINIIPIKLLLDVGYDHVIRLAQKSHLEGPFFEYPSLSLGCLDATTKEAVGMFNIFANNGVYVEPHFVNWIKDKWGRKIWRQAPIKERVLSARVAGQVTKVMCISIQRIQKLMRQKTFFPFDAFSKTGTTNDSRTCWFAGATPSMTTIIYLGRDDNQSLGENVYALGMAYPIWRELNEGIKQPKKKFAYDPSLKEVCIHEKTGEVLAHKDMPGAITIYV